MAYYDHAEQEQLDALKGWWHRWGALIALAIGLLLVSVAGYQGWSWYQRDQAAKASALYAGMSKAMQSGDKEQARALAKTVIEQHARTGYAPLAALAAARLSFEAGDWAEARTHLQWVIDHGRDEDLRTLARLRLAGVLLDEKQYDAALQLLQIKPEDPMANMFADLRGDVLAAQSNIGEARAAYQLALEKTDATSPYRNVIQIKIDALGHDSP